MKPILLLTFLSALVAAKPQLPTPPTPPPPIPGPSEPVPVPPPEKPEPKPEPKPSLPGKPPKDPLTPIPTVTGSPGKGPTCRCGYTYCASILKGMSIPWPDERLVEAYCKTPNAVCKDGVPPVDVTQALFICLCEHEDDMEGNKLDVLCGCKSCLVAGPDYRGRCESPCTELPAMPPLPSQAPSGGPD